MKTPATATTTTTTIPDSKPKEPTLYAPADQTKLMLAAKRILDMGCVVDPQAAVAPFNSAF
jgi:hypothetical protein